MSLRIWESLGVEPLLLWIKRWFGHHTRMPPDQVLSELHKVHSTGYGIRGRPRTHWRDYISQFASDWLFQPLVSTTLTRKNEWTNKCVINIHCYSQLESTDKWFEISTTFRQLMAMINRKRFKITKAVKCFLCIIPEATLPFLQSHPNTSVSMQPYPFSRWFIFSI